MNANLKNPAIFYFVFGNSIAGDWMGSRQIKIAGELVPDVLGEGQWADWRLDGGVLADLARAQKEFISRAEVNAKVEIYYAASTLHGVLHGVTYRGFAIRIERVEGAINSIRAAGIDPADLVEIESWLGYFGDWPEYFCEQVALKELESQFDWGWGSLIATCEKIRARFGDRVANSKLLEMANQSGLGEEAASWLASRFAREALLDSQDEEAPFRAARWAA
jgi:hypothetical protein